MGVGKTTVGRVLGERLSLPVSDSDVAIAQEHGATVRALDVELGVDGMHRMESAHLLEALHDPTPSIVCAAASVVDDPRCRAALGRPGVVPVWLRADPDLLASRFAGGAHRPLLSDDPQTLLRDQARVRSPRFAQLAQLTVDVHSCSPTEIADAIVRGL